MELVRCVSQRNFFSELFLINYKKTEYILNLYI